MRTELSFLMDLFLTDNLPLDIKKMIAERMKEVEQGLQPPFANIVTSGYMNVPNHQGSRRDNSVVTVSAPQPVTPEAAAALEYRQKLLESKMNEKPEQGRTGPRKV